MAHDFGAGAGRAGFLKPADAAFLMGKFFEPSNHNDGVGAADAGVSDFDFNLVGSRFRFRHILHFNDA